MNRQTKQGTEIKRLKIDPRTYGHLVNAEGVSQINGDKMNLE